MNTDPENLYETCQALLESEWVSDIHITAGDPLRVRGSGALLNPHPEQPVDDMALRDFLKRLRGDLADPGAIIRKSESQEAEGGGVKNGFDFSAPIGRFRCRCNLSFANGGCLSVVMRRLSDDVPPLENLGLPSSVIQQIKRPTGLVLVTGPTGSGKSTTLAAMLDNLNRNHEKHILTIEDPVEYLIKPALCKITRKEIGTDAPTFLSALRAAMRQDPDIIMVGEIRDLATMRAAMAAAETGHLVFATLHTNSAPKTVDRVASFFPPDEKEWAYAVFSSAINCIVSQTLIKRLNGEGRVMACEVLIGTSGMRSLIKEGKTSLISNAMEQGSKEGHQTMTRHLTELAAHKLISKEAAMAQAPDPDRMADSLSRAGVA